MKFHGVPSNVIITVLLTIMGVAIAAKIESGGTTGESCQGLRLAFSTITGQTFYTTVVKLLKDNCVKRGFVESDKIEQLVVEHLNGGRVTPFTVQEQEATNSRPTLCQLTFTGPDCTITASVDRQQPLAIAFRAQKTDGTGFCLDYDMETGMKRVIDLVSY